MSLAESPRRQTESGNARCAPRVLVFTTLFPNPSQPRLGVFVRNRVAAVARHCQTEVVAPVLSRLPGKRLEQGSVAAIPSQELQGAVRVHHPRFTTLPGIGRSADGVLLFWQTLSYVARLRAEFPFDLIDAHYGYPDGAAAVLLARRFRVPVCVTVRGGDLDLLTRFRMRRWAIERTMARADLVVAVSQHLVQRATAFGARQERVRLVPNGTEPETFSFGDQAPARRELGIGERDIVLVCVANLIAEKGHHIMIEALAKLGQHGDRGPRLMIIGSDQWGRQAYRRNLERRIVELRLEQRVQFLGSKTQTELRTWYCAADLVVLPTFREGCPNVVREALACGAPVVASRVGGVPELVSSERFGLLVEAGDPVALASTVRAALDRQWDRRAIAAGTRRTWEDVALEIRDEFFRLTNGSGQPMGAEVASAVQRSSPYAADAGI